MTPRRSSNPLSKLSESPLKVVERTQDVRGGRVVDETGAVVGRVDDLFVDERARKVRFLEVGTGGFLGLGETKFLVPVEIVTRLDDRTVRINRSQHRLAGAPRYDPALAKDTYFRDLYTYFGAEPYEYDPFSDHEH